MYLFVLGPHCLSFDLIPIAAGRALLARVLATTIAARALSSPSDIVERVAVFARERGS